MLRTCCAGVALALVLTVAGPNAQAQRAGLPPRAETPATPQIESPPPAPPVAPEPETIAPAPPPPAAARPSEPPRFVLPPGPVQVQVVPSPKTDAQLDAEQRDHDERAALSEQLELYAALLVAIAAGLALAFVVQALYLAGGLRAMRRLAQTADRNAIAAQRAFIHLGELAWRVDGTNVRITPAWVNTGTTPTRSMRISTNWKASAGELAADFAYIYTRPPEPLFLGPHGRAALGTVAIPMRDIEAAIDERVYLYVWGRAAYEDIFEGSKPHHFEFCHRVVVTGMPPGSLTLAFVQHGLRNSTDQDRPIHEPLSERA